MKKVYYVRTLSLFLLVQVPPEYIPPNCNIPQGIVWREYTLACYTGLNHCGWRGKIRINYQEIH